MKSWTFREAASAHALLTGSIWPKIKEALLAGTSVQLSIGQVSKTRDQEKHYHWLIGQIAAQAKHIGAKWSAADWKRLLLDDFAKEANLSRGRIIPSLDGTGIVEVGILSRRFNRREGADFITYLMAWGDSNGIVFPAYTPDTPEPPAWAVDQETGEIL